MLKYENKIKIIKPVPFGFAVKYWRKLQKDEVLIKKGTIIGFSEVGLWLL